MGHPRLSTASQLDNDERKTGLEKLEEDMSKFDKEGKDGSSYREAIALLTDMENEEGFFKSGTDLMDPEKVWKDLLFAGHNPDIVCCFDFFLGQNCEIEFKFLIFVVVDVGTTTNKFNILKTSPLGAVFFFNHCEL